MEGISDIKIVGLDTNRPPRVRKEPYIDLFFTLSHQVPADWCEVFNSLTSSQKITANIDATARTHIDTWVRSMEDIPKHLSVLQRLVAEAIKRYIDHVIKQRSDTSGVVDIAKETSGEQGRLNKIINGLNFET